MFRKVAEKQGFESHGESFLEFHEKLEKDEKLSKRIDSEIDRKIIEKAEEGNVVIEGWLAPHLIKKADLKVFLTVSSDLASERVAFREHDNKERELHITVKREESFIKRAKKEYDVDINDVSGFDIVINTEKFEPEETQEIIDTAISAIRRKRG
jgi:cytidylate kinase